MEKPDVRTVFVLAPHADDEVLGVGGTIARHVAQGDRVVVGVLTRGNPKLYRKELVEHVLRQELPAAHRILGVSETLFCDEFPAPGIDAHPQFEVSRVLSGWFAQVKPTVLYIPHRRDIHLDHQVAHEAAMVAARPGYSTIQRILAYEALSETNWAGPYPDQVFVPNVYVDIGAHLEAKLQAMAAYGSQFQPFPHPRSREAIEALARFRGSSVGVAAAEAFSLVRALDLV